MKTTLHILNRNQKTLEPPMSGAPGKGESQPPRKRIVVSDDMPRMATSSVKNCSRNNEAEYSIMKPATSSDSASTRSKGGRLVSARAEMKKITNIGNSGSQYQPSRPHRVSCALTMSLRLSEPAQSSTVMMTKPIETS